MKRAAFVLFTEPFLFPPTLHAAEVLAEIGWETEIFGMRIANTPQWNLSDRVNVSYLGTVRKGFALRYDYLRFIAMLLRIGGKKRFDVVFGYDQMAALPAFLFAKAMNARYIYHNHDLTFREQATGIFYRLVKEMEIISARHADAVTFPQLERAIIFKEQARLATDPIIILNCPRQNWILRASQDSFSEFCQWKKSVGRVIIYQGGIAAHRGLYPLVESIRHLTFEGGLCLVGLPLEEGIVDGLRRRAAEIGISERLLIIPPLAHDALPNLTARADVGVGVLAVGGGVPDLPKYINLKFLAGASNKIFEYMAAGLPILTSRDAGFEKYIEEDVNGVFCDGADPKSIATALNRLFREPNMWSYICMKNKAAFEKKYNYDVQFSPILKLLNR